MKAKIIRQWIWSSPENAMRNFGLDEKGDKQILRILVEDRRLVITPNGGNVHAFFLPPGTTYDVVEETDIPDYIVRLAKRVAEATGELQMYHRHFFALLSPVRPRIVDDESEE